MPSLKSTSAQSIEWTTSHGVADYGFLKRQGFQCIPISAPASCFSRHGPPCQFLTSSHPTPPVQPPAPAPHQSAPSSVPALSPAIDHATYASTLSSFPASLEDDNLSIGYDFIDSDSNPDPTSNITTSYYTPCFVDKEQCPIPFVRQPPTQSRGFLPTWILRPLLFLICSYSTCHQSLNLTTPLLEPTHARLTDACQSLLIRHLLLFRY